MQGLLKLSTAVNITVLMIDSSDHITGKTGLSAGLTIYATKAAGTPGVITPTVTELDSTNVKGLYKLAFTSGHTDTLGELQIHVTATGADPTDVVWQVSTYVPGEAATLQADQAVNTTKFGGTTVTGRDLGASVLLSTGTGTGQLDFTSGVVKANATQWLGGTIPAVNVTGVPLVDLKYTLGTISPATAGSVRADAVTGAVGSVTGAVGSVTGAVGSVTGSVGSVTGAVGSVTARVTANTDQLAGQTVTAAAGVTFPASVASPTNITAGVITTVTTVTNDVGITQTGADKVWATAARVLTAGTNIVLAKGVGVTGFNDLDAAGVRTAVGLASANLDTQLGAIAGYGDTEIAAIKSVTDKLNDTLQQDGHSPLRYQFTAGALELAPSGGAAPSAATIADAVWDEARAGHVTGGSFGEGVASVQGSVTGSVASVTGNVGGTVASVVGAVGSVTGAVGSVTGNVGGNVLGSVASVTGLTASDVGAIKAKTDNLPAAPSAVGDIPTAAQNADKLLGRTLAGSADGGRTVKDALRSLRNKTSITAGTLTVTEEDDTTTAWTATVTTAPGDPLTSIDPA